jgi:hypothetical protein
MVEEIPKYMENYGFPCPLLNDCSMNGIPDCDTTSDDGCFCIMKEYQMGKDLRTKDLYRIWKALLLKECS